MRASKVGALVSQIVTGGDDTPVGIDAEEVDAMSVDEAEAAGLDDEEEEGDSDESLELEDDSDPDEFGLDMEEDNDEEEEEEEDDDEEEVIDDEVRYTPLRDPEDLGRGKRLSLANLDDDGDDERGIGWVCALSCTVSRLPPAQLITRSKALRSRRRLLLPRRLSSRVRTG